MTGRTAPVSAGIELTPVSSTAISWPSPWLSPATCDWPSRTADQVGPFGAGAGSADLIVAQKMVWPADRGTPESIPVLTPAGPTDPRTAPTSNGAATAVIQLTASACCEMTRIGKSDCSLWTTAGGRYVQS